MLNGFNQSNGGVGSVGIATIPTQRLDVNGRARIRSLPSATLSDEVVLADVNGLLKKLPISSILSEPWFGADDNAAATLNTEDIYHLGNVGIGVNDPSERLEVNGIAQAKAYKSKVYTVRRTTNFTTSNSNVWTQFANLTQTITLTHQATVLINYNISMIGNLHLVSRLKVNNTIVQKAITGNTEYWNNSGNWSQTLAAGTHTIVVEYRTPEAKTLTPSVDWNEAVLQLTILGEQ